MKRKFDIKPYKDHYVLKFDEMFALYSNEFVFVKEIKFDDKIVLYVLMIERYESINFCY